MTNGILTASFFPNVPAAQSVADKKKRRFLCIILVSLLSAWACLDYQNIEIAPIHSLVHRRSSQSSVTGDSFSQKFPKYEAIFYCLVKRTFTKKHKTLWSRFRKDVCRSEFSMWHTVQFINWLQFTLVSFEIESIETTYSGINLQS